MTQAGAFDIVTVVFRGEMDLLTLQAASLERFFPEDLIRRIYIVPNDVDEAACLARIEAVLPAYGGLETKVEIVAPSALFSLRPADIGSAASRGEQQDGSHGTGICGGSVARAAGAEIAAGRCSKPSSSPSAALPMRHTS